jgi:hypothetical protein
MKFSIKLCKKRQCSELKAQRALLVALATVFSIIVLCAPLAQSSAQTTQTNFQNANSAISAAYVQIYNIQHNGGNASIFAARLNVAIGLYNKAELENASNPSQAALDLENATQIANSVQSQASPVAQKFEAQKEQQNFFSIGASVAVVVATILIYFFGGRIYDWIWMYQRKDYVVRSKNG